MLLIGSFDEAGPSRSQDFSPRKTRWASTDNRGQIPNHLRSKLQMSMHGMKPKRTQLAQRFEAGARSGCLTVDRVLAPVNGGLDEVSAAAVRGEPERLGLLPKVRATAGGWSTSDLR